MYKRAEYQLITERMKEPRRFIQVVMGARQIGKSTVVKQVLKDLDMPRLRTVHGFLIVGRLCAA